MNTLLFGHTDPKQSTASQLSCQWQAVVGKQTKGFALSHQAYGSALASWPSARDSLRKLLDVAMILPEPPRFQFPSARAGAASASASTHSGGAHTRLDADWSWRQIKLKFFQVWGALCVPSSFLSVCLFWFSSVQFSLVLFGSFIGQTKGAFKE